MRVCTVVYGGVKVEYKGDGAHSPGPRVLVWTAPEKKTRGERRRGASCFPPLRYGRAAAIRSQSVRRSRLRFVVWPCIYTWIHACRVGPCALVEGTGGRGK